MHKQSHVSILTKRDLKQLTEERDNLVGSLSAWGAAIPTSSMHWKREGDHLQWIVRQMSWRAPWIEAPANQTPVPQLAAQTKHRQQRRAECAAARNAENSAPVTTAEDAALHTEATPLHNSVADAAVAPNTPLLAPTASLQTESEMRLNCDSLRFLHDVPCALPRSGATTPDSYAESGADDTDARGNCDPLCFLQ